MMLELSAVVTKYGAVHALNGAITSAQGTRRSPTEIALVASG
jgi:hypothetical protein